MAYTWHTSRQKKGNLRTHIGGTCTVDNPPDKGLSGRVIPDNPWINPRDKGLSADNPLG